MKQFKRYGALIIGAIFLYDFTITFTSDCNGQFDVIGMEVSRTTYLAYLLAVAISFLSYGFTKRPSDENVSTTIQDQ